MKCSYETCARRDVKGLYAKAHKGGIDQFTGKDSEFEEPADGTPAMIIDTDEEQEDESLEKLYQLVSERVADVKPKPNS